MGSRSIVSSESTSSILTHTMPAGNVAMGSERLITIVFSSGAVTSVTMEILFFSWVAVPSSR